jgi:hypothetical protein
MSAVWPLVRNAPSLASLRYLSVMGLTAVRPAEAGLEALISERYAGPINALFTSYVSASFPEAWITAATMSHLFVALPQ